MDFCGHFSLPRLFYALDVIHCLFVLQIKKILLSVALSSDFSSTIRKSISCKFQTQGIEYFDPFKNFISKQKLQQPLKSLSNFSLVLFGKGRKIYITTLTNSCNNFDNSMSHLREICVSILRNPFNNRREIHMTI